MVSPLFRQTLVVSMGCQHSQNQSKGKVFSNGGLPLHDWSHLVDCVCLYDHAYHLISSIAMYCMKRQLYTTEFLQEWQENIRIYLDWSLDWILHLNFFDTFEVVVYTFNGDYFVSFKEWERKNCTHLFSDSTFIQILLVYLNI